ncbi:MAG TPA: hypothetical protein VMG38_00215 [Trebonia sp.]|nr:hypothetical protein [Trebonia sp.]
MNTYRRTVMAVITCAAGLSLAGCSVGITTARSGTSPSASASRPRAAATGPSAATAHSAAAASSSHSAPPQPGPVTMVPVNAPIHGFPVPKGGKVVYNISCPKQISIFVSPVTPAQSSSFYTSELPRAGYKIQGNIMSADPNTGAPQGLAEIDFSGHGYQGSVITMSNLGAEASADPSIGSLPGDLSKNVEEVMMSAPGTPDSYVCPS